MESHERPMSLHNEDQPIQRRRRPSSLWIVGVFCLLLVGIGYGYLITVQDPQLRFKTAMVEQGTIARVVTATGTVEPVLSVEVGSEVSGTIQSLQADFNSIVNAGDVIASIDPEPFQARLEQEQARLLSAKARLAQADAELSLKNRDLMRAKALLEQGFISQADLDVAQTEYQSAVAQVDLNRALVNQATAAVDVAQFDLNHTVIYSPVDGTVIDRKINAGQTVAASFQTPALFVIAADLTRMRVIAHVGEADIADVGQEQPATFQVDAYPDREFSGRVTQVRIASKAEDTVVTYDVAIDVENPELLLKPGMTADVAIVVESVSKTLIIPNVALRFSPPAASSTETQTHDEAIAETGGEETHSDASGSKSPAHRSSVWILSADGTPRKIMMSVGLTDDRFSEIKDGSLKLGDLVLVGVDRSGEEESSKKLPPWFR
ncbi:MAG TPA: efflux RND transporter periplasmic adaptor subunit [Nitrospirales bacterium]|nr:efflux RND transporter periplasmic adaptor subunit [Nitrospirales bacterium]